MTPCPPLPPSLLSLILTTSSLTPCPLLSSLLPSSLASFPPHSPPQSLPQYNDLLKKKQIVENDKSKIVELIEELDQKKNEALKGAYERVNKVPISLLLPPPSLSLHGSMQEAWL